MKRETKKQASRAVVEGGATRGKRKAANRKSGPASVSGPSHVNDATAAQPAGAVAQGNAAVEHRSDDGGRTGGAAQAVTDGGNDHPNNRFNTGLGIALGIQNERTLAALKAHGHRMEFVPAHRIHGQSLSVADIRKAGKAALTARSPFETDPKASEKMARIGASIAGVDVARPIVWPDMKKVEEQAKANRPPMSEETKAALRERAKANPRDKGDQVAIMLREAATLDDTYTIAAKYLGEKLDELKAKYTKLNPGQQRMVLGNRMRAKYKKDNLSAEGRATKAKA